MVSHEPDLNGIEGSRAGGRRPEVPPGGGITSAETEAGNEAVDGLIHSLPDTLVSKIAAGEVVQRPANVVKELVENSIDAGARQVDVIVSKAGSSLIQVVDDGSGMGPQDATAAFGRHTTSKLQDFGDLERISTHGFRGEALASIASVAQVELKTRRIGDDTGTLVRIEGGEAVAERPEVAPVGTSVSVRNLFFNVPARRAFLKTPATEFRHIIEAVRAVALANPRIAFMLEHDGNEVLRVEAIEEGVDRQKELQERVRGVLGPKVADALVPIDETTSYVSVSGVVGKPDVAARSRSDQYLFINGRVVKDHRLAHAVTTAFGGLLPENRYAVFVLSLTLDSRRVDVNVHPTKMEVKFDDEQGIYGFLKTVVKKGLADHGLAFTTEIPSSDSRPGNGGFPSGTDSSSPFKGSSGRTTFPAGERGRRHARGGDSWKGAWPSPETPEGSFGAESLRSVELAALGSGPIPSRADGGTPSDSETGEGRGRAIWQLLDRFVLTPIRSGLLLIDRRAAHERILFERAMAQMQGGIGGSQQLLFPVEMRWDPDQVALLQELSTELTNLGFEVKVKGRRITLTGVPLDITPGDEEDVLADVIAQYVEQSDTPEITTHEKLARSLARRSAIRSGRHLPDAEVAVLVDQLFACEDPFTSAWGRPTMVEVSEGDLARLFRR